MIIQNFKRLALLMLLALLTACATSKPNLPNPAPVAVPAPPQELMDQEDLSESYSTIVQRLLRDWQQKLIDWRTKS